EPIAHRDGKATGLSKHDRSHRLTEVHLLFGPTGEIEAMNEMRRDIDPQKGVLRGAVQGAFSEDGMTIEKEVGGSFHGQRSLSLATKPAKPRLERALGPRT